MQLPEIQMDYTIDHQPGVITIKNGNTTLAFVRYTESAEIEYIFVRRHYRRQGLASLLLERVEAETGSEVKPQAPISPLGAKLFDSRNALA